MEYKCIYLPEFEKVLDSLPKKTTKQILKKIKTAQEAHEEDIFSFFRRLVVPIGSSTHRMRVGDYRIFCKIDGRVIEFQNIDPRKEAYRKRR